MKELSLLTETFTESVIREMTRICDSMGGYNLSQGFPDFESPKAIKEAAIEAIKKDLNQYPITFGELELRQAIAKKALWYNEINCDAEEEITVTCGATEAMIATLKAIINPGDEVVLFEPFYENYGPDSILSGAIPRYVTLHAPNWQFDFEELSSAFNEKTKAIIINTPNNPTGKVFSKEELAFIASLCKKYDTYAITDEIYEHILYDGKKHVSLASLPQMFERTITINSISKTYAVTGWRVGWAIADKKITQRIRKVHDFLTVGAPTPFQHAAAEALLFEHSYYKKVQEHYQKAREFLYQAIKKAGFDCTLPQGAYYLMADATKIMQKNNIKSDFAFSEFLIKKAKVATVPGTAFYKSSNKGSNEVRFCFCKKWTTLEQVALNLQKL